MSLELRRRGELVILKRSLIPEASVCIAFLILVFSYNYHFLWIIYDCVLLVLLLFFFMRERISLSLIEAILLLSCAFYFVMISLVSQHPFVGLLSFWDIFKHLILIILFKSIFFGNSYGSRYLSFSKSLFPFIMISFVIQFFVVLIQFVTKVHFDNIAGTFGDGASHSIAYFSLLAIASSVSMRKSFVFLGLVVVAASIMNVAAENVAFFVLLFILGFALIVRDGVRLEYVMLSVVLASIFFYGLSFSIYSESMFIDVVMARISEMLSFSSDYDLGRMSRNDYIALAWDLGGWFGNGPGSYSNIYLLEGYDIDILIDPQINISEASHLIAEDGVFGLVLSVTTYLVFLTALFKNMRPKVYLAVFFLCCLFYSVLLTNETHIFLFFLLVFYLNIFFKSCYSYNNYKKI